MKSFIDELDLPKDFFINCTVSFLNVYYMPEFLQWCIDNKWYMGFNILFLPDSRQLIKKSAMKNIYLK